MIFPHMAQVAVLTDNLHLPEPPIRLDRSADENVNNSKHSSDAIENTETE